ncbi:helix-turn-helix domain-containing protein [Streptomyces acidiscabies]|nr:helix-turn-helix domain-containing protein [Streptomyces acidiscabies]
MDMTTSAAAAELHCSVNTLKKLIAAGLLPEVRERGNRTLLPAGDVRALARREAVDLDALELGELPVLRVGPAVGLAEGRELIGYSARLMPEQMYEALRGWWRCDPERVLRVGVLAVTLGPYVVAVLGGFRHVESNGAGRYRFAGQLEGYVMDLVTPVQVVRGDAPLARRLLGRRLESDSGGPVAYVWRPVE